jgi:hypothetical protein
MVKPREEASAARVRSDGRRQFLIYLQPEIILELKRAALDQDRPAYEVAEEAIREWLRTRRKRKK